MELLPIGPGGGRVQGTGGHSRQLKGTDSGGRQGEPQSADVLNVLQMCSCDPQAKILANNFHLILKNAIAS